MLSSKQTSPHFGHIAAETASLYFSITDTQASDEVHSQTHNIERKAEIHAKNIIIIYTVILNAMYRECDAMECNAQC